MIDTVFNILKITVVIAIAAVFMVTINTFITFIGQVIFGGFISEFFALISMYLPFNALSVFGAIGTATVAILSFMIAKKIFDLSSWSISAI